MSITSRALVGLAAAGLLLAGCSGTPAATTTPTPSASSPSSAEPTASLPAGPVPAAAKNACAVIGQAAIEKIVGAKLGTASPQTDPVSSLCTYGPATGGTVAAALLVGPTEGTLESEVKSLSGRTTSPKVAKTTVSGADEAVLLTAQTTTGPTTAVFATKGPWTYGGIIRTKGGSGSYEAACRAMVAALIKA